MSPETEDRFGGLTQAALSIHFGLVAFVHLCRQLIINTELLYAI